METGVEALILKIDIFRVVHIDLGTNERSVFIADVSAGLIDPCEVKLAQLIGGQELSLDLVKE